ncbi:basic proline-rich protein-like [Canis lupus dingo]|uniref:basic proline-rich protein-like n=1 Tax=Canis lupus dingo TaxID=286419 RepID=UPI0020C57CDA|nr:basic proline-rich protein-like [Canis lupus dingo]
MLTTIPPTLHSPGRPRTPAQAPHQRLLALSPPPPPPAAALPRRAGRPQLCAVAGATSGRPAPHPRHPHAALAAPQARPPAASAARLWGALSPPCGSRALGCPPGSPAPCPLPPPGSRAAVRRVSEEPVAASLPSGGPGWAGPSPHAPGRQGARADEEGQGRGGGARDQKRACLASPSGNRTPVSRVTGGDTHHYTNEDGGGGRPGARPLSARPPAGLPACPRPPGPSTSRAPVLPGARHVPRATAHPARPPGRRVSAHSSPPARLGASRPRTRRRPRPAARGWRREKTPDTASRGPKCRQPRAGRATLPLRGAPRSPPRSPSPALHLPPPARRERGVPTACPFRRPRPFIPWSPPPPSPGRPRGVATRRPHHGHTPARRAAEPSARQPETGPPPRSLGLARGGGVGSTPPWWLRGALSARQPCLPGPPPRRKPLRGRGSRTPARSLTAPPASQPAGGRSAQAHLPASPPPQPSRPRRRAAGRAHTPFFGLLAWALLGGPHLRRRHRRRHAHTRTHLPPPHPAAPRERTQSELRAPAGPRRRALHGPESHPPMGLRGAPGGKGRSALSCAGHRRPALPGNRARVRLGQAAPPGRTVSGGGPAPGRGRRVSRVRLGASLGPWAPRAGPSPSPSSSPSPSPRRICTGAEPVLQTAGPPPAPAQRVLTTGRAGTTTSAAGEAVWWPPPPVHGWFSGRILACHAGGPGSIPGPCSAPPPFGRARAPGFLAHALKPQGLSLNQLCSRRGPCPPAPPRFPLPTCLFWSLARGRQPWPPRSTRLPPRDALYGHLAAVSFKHGPLPTAKVTASTRSIQPSQHRRQHTQPRGTAPPPRLSPARRVHERRRTSMGITAKGTEDHHPTPAPAPAPAPAPGLPPPCQKQLYQQQQQQQQQQQRDVPTASRPA